MNHQAKPSAPPIRNIVFVYCIDGEYFPVKRRLLRPCISLTSVVQAGKGKYNQAKQEASHSDVGEVTEDGLPVEDCLYINVESCTFDRVLLYLEHEARGEEFKFDPLIAAELRLAAIELGIRGLQELAEKVLGNFEERVRKTPISLDEVIRRNEMGSHLIADTNGNMVRGDTLIILNGMVNI